MALEQEIATYEKNKASWAENKGRWVVIFQTRVVGMFNDYEDALKAGYTVAKTAPFLCKRIEHIESAHHFSRDLSSPCPTSVSR